MAERSICLNCGNPLRNKQLVCKSCHQARWKLIIPYFIWSVVFLVAAWWLIKNKLTDALYATDFLSLLIIIATVLLGILGVVMLLIALIATLKGLFVNKVSAEQRDMTVSQLSRTTSVPLNMAETADSSATSFGSPFPKVSPSTQPESLEFVRTNEQIIYCQKCKHENAPEATHCSQCGTDLLPGEGAAERVGTLIGTTLVALLGFGGAYLFFKYNPEWGLKALLFLGALIVSGVFAVFYGIFLTLRKIPLRERYEKRAKRHVSLREQNYIKGWVKRRKLAQIGRTSWKTSMPGWRYLKPPSICSNYALRY
jgi:ribosomal protein L40E